MIEYVGGYEGLRYVIIFDEDFGYRCGYVGIPKYIKSVYMKNWDDDFISTIDCHGGITFSDFYKEFDNEDYDDELWWIGFDCSHGCDGVDIPSMWKYGNEERVIKRQKMPDYKYKQDKHVYTLEECKEDCISIIKQIAQKYESELLGE